MPAAAVAAAAAAAADVAADVRGCQSVSVELRLEGSGLAEAEVLCLLLGHLGEVGPELSQVEAGHVLVDLLGQQVDLALVAVGGRVVQLHQGQRLGARVHRHHETWNAEEYEVR